MLMSTQRPERAATLGELQRELAVIMARMNGLISENAADVWARDLVGENLAACDVSEAGRRLPAHIAAPDRGEQRGKVALTDIVQLARRARTERLEGRIQAAPRLAAANERDLIDLRAGALVSRLIARALMRDPGRFAKTAPEALTAWQNALREQIAEAIRADPQVTDVELMQRFGGAS